ncbi:drug/metabolite exporter YedA [Echinicola sediminis]
MLDFNNNHLKANFALCLVCVVWGTTYYAIKIGVEAIPPFIFLGVRHLTAGLLLVIALLFMPKHRKFFKWKYFRLQVIPGILLIGIGNGLLGLAEKYIPTALVGIIYSLVPIVVLVYNVVSDRNYPVNKYTLSSILCGLLGVFLLFKGNLENLSTDTAYVMGVVISFICALSWAVGGIISKRIKSESSTFVNTAFQLIAGGAFLLVLSVGAGEQLPSHYESNALWSLGYLIIVASLLTYNAYIYSLKYLPLEKVAVHTYVNPLVAIFLGWAFLEESISFFTLVAVFLILVSIYFMNRSKRVKKYRTETSISKGVM